MPVSSRVPLKSVPVHPSSVNEIAVLAGISVRATKANRSGPSVLMAVKTISPAESSSFTSKSHEVGHTRVMLSSVQLESSLIYRASPEAVLVLKPLKYPLSEVNPTTFVPSPRGSGMYDLLASGVPVSIQFPLPAPAPMPAMKLVLPGNTW